jgi:thioesterase domain-containing protein
MNLRFLAVALGTDQPFYGLQHRGADGRLRPHRRIEDMAREFLHDVRAIQPRGPYYIAGYSAGGLPAYEMACMLAESGAAVGLVILIDTGNPTAPNWSMRERLGEHLDNLVQRGPGYLANRAVNTILRRVKEGDRSVRAKLAERFPFKFRLEALVHSGEEAVSNFRPRPYRGRVLLLQADWRLTAGEGIGYKPHQANGWLDYVRGPLEVTHIPCSHLDIVSEHVAPHAAKVAKRALAIAYKSAEASSRPSAPPPPSSVLPPPPSHEGKDRTAGPG